MTKKLEIYKCEVCGNIVEVLTPGDGELVCCSQAMLLLKENSVEGASEKHIPVIEKIDGGYRVKVGEKPHPMEADHYIEWIELIVNGKAYRQFLTPSNEAEAIFKVEGENVFAKEHCNLHGLWKS